MNGVLILSHFGYSFLEEIIDILREKNINVFILSSYPKENYEQREKYIRENSDAHYITRSYYLTEKDVLDYHELLKSLDKRVLFSISVWEGYRSITALLNRQIGIPDLTQDAIKSVLNKYRMRKEMSSKNLSKVNSYLIENEKDFNLIKEKNGKFFLKPSSGIASYGTFILESTTQWNDLLKVQDDISKDLLYRNIFNPKLSFVAEDYINGNEYSLELIVNIDFINIIAIHQKIAMNSINNSTTLEGGSISPPVSLNAEITNSMKEWLLNIFNTLDLNFGCFHVEAKYDPSKNIWEIIEINPRVGGSFISLSVKQNTGKSMIEHWIDLLIYFSMLSENKISFNNRKIKSVKSENIWSTHTIFFRTYFAHSGTIENLELKNSINANLIASNIFLKKGDIIPDLSREQFAAQIMWELDEAISEEKLNNLIMESNNSFQISYKI